MKKQTSFSDLYSETHIKKTYGGSLILGKRKSRRPLDSKKPLHLVLKAIDSNTLLKNRDLVEQIIYALNQKFGIKLQACAIHYDHVHLCLNFQNRRVYVMWIRALTGVLARKVDGLKFKFLPFTRIVGGWGKDFRLVRSYIEKNQAEADFLIRVHAHVELGRDRVYRELKLFAFQRGAIFQSVMDA